ncbi:SusC/RagA family TonB-linked outer membrane protein [Spirosoma sp. KNUC1025]|uniref:SusC/RagA family TonB-linked outer membrane protein n=1 Tax=Spirosoma sp. KNUC1025 TaxID=2894082 RepID=UPI001E570EAF|nr:SusC/RagA family TonB-linked outer membrane protein [Spirosoma sp. KNUC1025]UFH57957.1 SusC/RagA family TonB-linked outer membrane protein [Spirosoma sp. KNUC1025]
MKRRILVYTSLWLFCFLGVQQAIAQLTFASVHRTQEEIRSQETGTSLITVLKKLELTYRTSFVYQKELLENKTFTGSVNENDKLEQVLDRILTPVNLRFRKLKGGGYTILPRKATRNVPPETELLKTSANQLPEPEADKALAINTLASRIDIQALSTIKSADIVIKGKVTDTEKGEPVPGASIVLKGATKGTNTDANGFYSIAVPDQNAVLVFSFVGFDKQEVIVGNRVQINITLKPDMKELNEVVVVGFGTQKKATVTGAIAAIGTKDLLQSPVANISNSLVGRMPGLFAVQTSGEPGNNASTLRIRGVSTFSGASDPLILVNGVEVSNYNNIDPNEIENLTILKDASATAIYGIRGANGVLLITTKRGKVGKPQLSYTGNVAVTSFTNLRKGMNSYDYARLYNESLKNDAYVSGAVYVPKFTDADLALYKSGEDPIFHPNTDWYSMVLKPQALQTQHNLSINGGTEKVRYFVSAGFFSQGGQFNHTDLVKDYDANRKYKRYNFRSSFDFDVTKKLKLSIDLSSQTENLTGSSNLNGTANNSNRIIEGIARANPLTSPGFIGDKFVNLVGVGTANNPLADLFTGYNRQFKNFLQGAIRLDYTLDFITQGLMATGIVNYQNNNTETLGNNRTLVTYNAIRLPDNSVNLVPQAVDVPFGFTQTIGKTRRTYAQVGFDYKRAFGDHYVTGLVNYNQTKYFDPTLAFLVPNSYQGVVGRATYGYKGRYLAEFTFGYNGTENFAPGNRFGFFPAYSLGWVASDEPFFPKNDVLTYLKIRGSYGEVGNDKIGGDRFLYRPSAYVITTASGTGGYYFGEVGSTSTRYNYSTEGKLGNPNVTWERAIKQNLGVEMSFWKSKISLTADVFSEQRNNILGNLGTVPVTVGATLPAYNLGRMRNRGFDADITYNDHIGNVNFWIKGNFTFARNKIEFQDEIKKPFSYQNRTGQRFGQFYGLVADGLYNTWAEVNDANRPVSSWNNNRLQPGDIRYKDTNGDGIINDDDQVPIGYSNFPEKIFGISFGGSYKGFDISVLFQGAGNVSLAYNRRQIRGFFENSGAVDYLVNSWSADRYEKGLPIQFPRLTQGDENNHNNRVSTYWVRDASYVRLKNVEIGYNIPKTILAKIGLSGTRIYANASNLITWSTVFPGVDPELSGTAPGSTSGGITNEEPYPLTRVINFGLNLKF